MPNGVIASFRQVLVLAPHTDDEFGCAGTVLRLLEGGAIVNYVAMSRCEESVPAGMPQDILEHECRECTRRLGVEPNRVRIEGFRVRHFPEHRQEILESFVRLRKEFDPDLVLLPASFDTHQDHATVFHEGFRAFKQSSILGYELPQNLISFQNSAFVTMTEQHLTRKSEALRAYASQAFRDYAADEFITGLARMRGVQCGSRYAEAFEVIRLIL